MSWVTVGVAVAGAYMGAQKNKRAKEVEDADRKLAAETEKYSWATGNKAGPIRNAGSAMFDIGQGAASGAMFGQQFGKGMNKTEATPGADAGGFAAKPGDYAGGIMPGDPGMTSDGGGSWQKMMEDEERRKGMMGGSGLITG